MKTNSQKSLGLTLKTQIEAATEELLSTNLFFKRSFAGEFTRFEMAMFLFNIRFIVGKTPEHLELAVKRSRELNLDQKITDGFAVRIPEEAGHDLWATRDLEVLNLSKSQSSRLHLTNAIQKIEANNRKYILRHPGLYCAYMLWAEYFTVLVVPRWAEALEARCGIPRSAISVLTNHAELDKEHVADDIRLLIDPLEGVAGCSLSEMQEVITTSFAHYNQMAREIYEATQYAHADTIQLV